MSDIALALASIRERIARAAHAAGRDERDVHLLAVSKTKPALAIREAYAAGQRDFGENYAQEIADKHSELADLDGIRWHFIGHLQSNKAKLVAPFATAVHSVDGIKLVHELGRRAQGRATRLSVLVEVNVGGEASKSGVGPGELADVLSAVESEPSLKLAGLMSIPPPSETPEGSRHFHRMLRDLRDAHGGAARLPELSMGMSDDLEIAIAEGATWVRVGTAIFGARAKP